jgi:hypothetical protein
VLSTSSPVQRQQSIDGVSRDLNWEFLCEWSATAASLWRSAEEAAFRGDILAFSVHLRQARIVTFSVTQTLTEAFGNADGVA